MAWSDLRVDVGLWNLGVVAAAAGCGPLIPLDGETETDGPNDDDDDPNDDDGPWTDTEGPYTTTPTTSWPDTDTDPWNCDCDPGYVCIDGACVWDDYCYYGSGGYGYCCDGDDCCYYGGYGCYYNDCYYAEDCGAGSFCALGWNQSYFVCEPADELPACAPDDVATRVISLPAEASTGAVALAFADAEAGGGLELIVVQPGQARVVANGGASAIGPVALPTAEADASATGVGTGFAVSSPAAEGTQLVVIAEGALAAGPIDGLGLASIVGGDLDGDGTDDVAGLDGDTLWWLRGTANGFATSFDLESSAYGPLVAGDFGGDGNDDIAVHQEYGYPIYIHGIENGGFVEYLDGRPAMVQSLVGADFDGDGSRDIVGVTGSDGTMLVFPWIKPAAGDFGQGSPRWMTDLEPQADGRYDVGGGDFDGDGYEDVVVGSTTTLRVVFGQAFQDFRCYADIPIPHAATALAVGDLDGDGRSDAAFSDGMTTTVLAHQ